MIDLETLSTRGHSVIVAIAGIKFDRKAPHAPLEKMKTFFERVNTDSCVSLGLHVDPKTVSWWNSQDPEIKEELFKEPRSDIKSVLIRFSEWFKNSKLVWSHGATFDIPILAEAYSRCDMTPPWEFWDARDTRTIFDLARITNKDLPREKQHHPLNDCWRQIWGVKESMKKLKS